MNFVWEATTTATISLARLVERRPLWRKDMPQKCFVDSNGVIYTVYDDETSNYPGDIQVHKSRREVHTLGDEDELPGRLVKGTYTLHASLTALASVIEPPA